MDNHHGVHVFLVGSHRDLFLRPLVFNTFVNALKENIKIIFDNMRRYCIQKVAAVGFINRKW